MAQLNYGITLIVIVAMSCTYGHAMHTEDHKDSVAQTTVASILTQIAYAVDVVTKDNQPNEWEKSIDLLKKIFVQEKKPHTNLEIFRDQNGYIKHNYKKNPYSSLPNLTNDPNLIFVIKHNSTKISIEKTEENLFKPTDSNNYYLEHNTLSLVKTIISQCIKQPENELPENEKLEISYSKNLEHFEEILSTSVSNNVFICLQKEQLIPALFCSYFLSCIIQYIRNQGNLTYEYYNSSNKDADDSKEKLYSGNIILIGSCGSLILCLSAILYWYYKK